MTTERQRLRFDRYRVRASADEMTDAELDLFYSGPWLQGRTLTASGKRAELAEIWDDDIARLEIVDVFEATGAHAYVMFFFTGGSALVHDARTHEVVAAAAQHALDRAATRELWEALGEAYATSEPKIREHVTFAVSPTSASRFRG